MHAYNEHVYISYKVFKNMNLPSEVYFIWMIEESFHWRVFFIDVLPSRNKFALYS